MEYFVVRPEAPPPTRDRMPTAEYDLSEFAWLHTGPSSWSAEPELDDPRRNEIVALADVVGDDDASVIDDREAYVLSLVAPRATIADVIDMAGMPASEVLAVLASLAMRGIITVERDVTPASR